MTLREKLAHYPRRFSGEFIPVSRAVPIGHVFTLSGEPWQVVWCQPNGRAGWLAMAVKRSDLPQREAG